MTIKFIGNEIGGITAFKGFSTSYDLLAAVRDKGFRYYDETKGDMYCCVLVGDYLFDYETGTMWEVVEEQK